MASLKDARKRDCERTDSSDSPSKQKIIKKRKHSSPKEEKSDSARVILTAKKTVSKSKPDKHSKAYLDSWIPRKLRKEAQRNEAHRNETERNEKQGNEKQRNEKQRNEVQRNEKERNEKERNEKERNEKERNEKERNEKVRCEMLKNETKRNEKQRNEMQRNETFRNAMERNVPNLLEKIPKTPAEKVKETPYVPYKVVKNAPKTLEKDLNNRSLTPKENRNLKRPSSDQDYSSSQTNVHRLSKDETESKTEKTERNCDHFLSLKRIHSIESTKFKKKDPAQEQLVTTKNIKEKQTSHVKESTVKIQWNQNRKKDVQKIVTPSWLVDAPSDVPYGSVKRDEAKDLTVSQSNSEKLVTKTEKKVFFASFCESHPFNKSVSESNSEVLVTKTEKKVSFASFCESHPFDKSESLDVSQQSKTGK